MKAEVQRLPWWRAPTWATGQIAVQLFRDTPSLLLLFYMTQVLAVPPGLAGVAIFGPKLIWGVLCDYSVGVISDRVRARFPRRHFLLAGALLGPVAMVLLFQPSAAADAQGRAVHVALMLSLYMLVFALFSVPHLAIGAGLSAREDERAAVMGWRIAFANVGLLVGASAAPILLQRLGGGAPAYQTMSALLGAVVAVTLLVSWFGAREAWTPLAANIGSGNWRAAFRNRRFLVLFGALLLQLSASGASYASFAYLFTFYLRFDAPLATLGVIVLVSSVCAIASQPLWVRIANRWGRKPGFLLATAGYAGALLSFLAVPPGNAALAYGAGALIGVFNSGCYLTAYAMLSDLIGDEPSDAGRAGFYSSLFVANDKIGFTLGGTLIAGALLQAFGFQPGAHAVQPAEALTGIAVAFGGAPLLLNTAAFALVALLYPARRAG